MTFIIFARKAQSLGARTVLASWLHRTAVFVAADALKAQRRRIQREQEAHRHSEIESGDPGPVWEFNCAAVRQRPRALGRERSPCRPASISSKRKPSPKAGGALDMTEVYRATSHHRALEKPGKSLRNTASIQPTPPLPELWPAGSLQLSASAVPAKVCNRRRDHHQRRLRRRLDPYPHQSEPPAMASTKTKIRNRSRHRFVAGCRAHHGGYRKSPRSAPRKNLADHQRCSHSCCSPITVASTVQK